MLEVDSTLALPVPVGRVRREVTDFNRYRDWHPLPPISAQAKVVRFELNASVAWEIRLRGLVAVEEGFELQKTEHGTEVRHRMRCSGIAALLGIGLVQRRMDRALAVTNRCLSNFLARGKTNDRSAPMRGRQGTRRRR